MKAKSIAARVVPAEGATLGRAPLPRLGAWAWLALGAAPALGGCAMSFPMGSMLPDQTTGSLSTVPFGGLLDSEDQRREKAALATALDPQGDGSTVHWENPKTGRKGSLTAVGHAYPKDSHVCRAFEGSLEDGGSVRKVAGTACTVAVGEWAVKDTAPAKKA